jgi:hypothetical protein
VVIIIAVSYNSNCLLLYLKYSVNVSFVSTAEYYWAVGFDCSPCKRKCDDCLIVNNSRQLEVTSFANRSNIYALEDSGG